MKMTEANLFFRFMVLLCLFMAAHLCYAVEKVEVLNHLNRLNKPAVKSIKSPDGDTIDCVRISQQLAFDHPLLKNHTIKTRPSYVPNWAKDDNINMTSSSKEAITQLWHSNGKCPKGTIPVIRTNFKDVLRANSVESYAKKKKKNFGVAEPGVTDGHEYAHATTDHGVYYGAKAIFNLWNPKVQEDEEFSLGQLWILGGSYPDLNTIEAGWQVYQGFYGDTNTRLFIYWTSDGYQQAGCYNIKCSGFVQTNQEIAIGGSLTPTSQIDGSQYDMTILIFKDTKQEVWWMQLNGKIIGYWPASLFTYLSASASVTDFGGEVINRRSDGHHTTTQMGSGHFPQQGFTKASYIKNIQTVDESNALRTPQKLNVQITQKSCYDLVTGMDANWGSYFFYGGPGRNQNCP